MGRRPFVRQKILEAAFDLIARQGYEAVSTRDIATAAEVGPASMYRHFATKLELGRELYAVALAPLLTQAAAWAEAPAASRKRQVEALIDWLYTAYDERPRAVALLVFPPHEFTPWEVDDANEASIRRRVAATFDLDDDLLAICWGACTGPLVDRFLTRRSGAMAPHAPAHASLIHRLLPRS